MSGPLVGEVQRHRRALRAAGVPKPAAELLVVLAEQSRGERIVSQTIDYLVVGADSTARSISRHLALLKNIGVLTVLRRGGGRGHAGRPPVYRIAELDQWLPAHGQVWVATESEAVAHYGRPGGGSIPAGGDPIDLPTRLSRQPSGGSSTDRVAVIGGSIGDSPATDGRLTRHLGGDLPVVPEELPGETPELTTGPRDTVIDPPPAAAPSRKPSPRPRTTPEPGTGTPAAVGPPVAATGSRCGRRDCRAPGPCGPCGQARRAEQDRELDVVAALSRSTRDAVAEAVAQRQAAARAAAAAAAACVLGCTAGYLGTRVCDHDPERLARQARGSARVRDELRAARAARDARQRAEQDVRPRTASASQPADRPPAAPATETAVYGITGYGPDPADVATQPHGIPMFDDRYQAVS